MTCWPAAAAAAVGLAVEEAAEVAAVAAVGHVLEAEEVGRDLVVAGHDLAAAVAVAADIVAVDMVAVGIWLAARRACRGRRRSNP